MRRSQPSHRRDAFHFHSPLTEGVPGGEVWRRRWYDLAMQPDRATAMLAVVRIISVLGMALAISSGIFMLLGGWVLPALAALACFFPFFFLMRFMEKRALRDDL
jgi:hypothetical protein